MTDQNDEILWQKISQTLFKPRPYKDERLFTANVMARVRQLQPVDATWPIFMRWALPVLALSFGGFLLTLSHYFEPSMPRTEAVIMGERDAAPSVDWIVSADTDDSEDEVANS